MGIFGGGADRQEYLALENRVARLEEQVARLLAAPPAAAAVGGPGTAGAASHLAPTVAAPLAAPVAEPGPASAPLGGLTPDALEEARRLKDSDKAIHAIKLVRERTGWSLRDAKDYVDQL